MSYIRGALPLLIYNPNTRDDIVPNGVDSSYPLSQEVPGGYEGNVQVIRRQFKHDVLLENCAFISFVAGSNTIRCSNANVAAALASIRVGDVIQVSNASNSTNNDRFEVVSKSYDGLVIEFGVDKNLVGENEGSGVTLNHLFKGPWEVLEPEVDYTISGEDEAFNKIINFSEVPREEDVIYVIHRGEATYNFVPTEKSVGPEQLQENLRNFTADLFRGDGTTTTFILSQVAVNPRALEVSIDGEIQYPTDPDVADPSNPSGGYVGAWELSNDGLAINFVSAPVTGVEIYVRHLGFSTISRRQALSPSQLGDLAPGSVRTIHLANNAVTAAKLNDASVSATKIAPNAVTGSKVLLGAGESLRMSGKDGATESVLSNDNTGAVSISSSGEKVQLNLGASSAVSVTPSVVKSNSFADLGTFAEPFKDGHFSGTVKAVSAEFSNNASVAGDLTVAGNINSDVIVSLQAALSALQVRIEDLESPGTIKLWARDSDAPAGFLLCDGKSYLVSDYPELFDAIGYNFGGSGASFNVPDMRGRFPLGKTTAIGVEENNTGGRWGQNGRGGELDHTHSNPAHSHIVGNHRHTILPHKHGPGNIAIRESGSVTVNIAHTHAASATQLGGEHIHINDNTKQDAREVFPTSTTSTDISQRVVTGYQETLNAQGQENGLTTQTPRLGTWADLGLHLKGYLTATGMRDIVSDAASQHKHDIAETNTGYADLTHSHNLYTRGEASTSHTHWNPDALQALTGDHPWVATQSVGAEGSSETQGRTKPPIETLNHRHAIAATNTKVPSLIWAVDESTQYPPRRPTPLSSGAATEIQTGYHRHRVYGIVRIKGSAHTHIIPATSLGTVINGVLTQNVTSSTHTHISSDFAGNVGSHNSANDGDVGFLSDVQSASTSTDLSGATTSGSANPAYQTLHYIIKH